MITRYPCLDWLRRRTFKDYVLVLIAAWFCLGFSRLDAATDASDPGTGLLLLGDRPALGLETVVDIDVIGMVAEVGISQRFRNPTAEWVEGQYGFPLPDDAAVHRMEIEVDGRRIVGEIQEKAQARRTYAAARDQGQRASLVTQRRPNLFTTRVANIPPGGEIAVTLGYVQTLNYRDGRFSLRFPMTVTPRYRNSGAASSAGSAEQSVASAPAEPLTLSVKLQAGFRLARLESVHHPVDIEDLGHAQRVVLGADAHNGDHDFELIWEPILTDTPQAALFTQTVGEEHFGLMMMLPPTPQYRSLQPRELILVIDTSGSMQGASLAQAKESLLMAVGSLGEKDRFNLIEFNSRARALFRTPVDADPTTIAKAVAAIEGLSANGGTEMAPALDLALSGDPPGGYVRQVVFVTDGAVGNEIELFSRISERLGEARLFTVGIGAAPNTYFMRKAAEFGRGSYTYIGKLGEVAEKMDRLLVRLEHPVLTNVCVEWPGNAEAYPGELPDLYLGEPLVVAARLSTISGKILACGDTAAAHWEESLGAKEARGGYAVAKLWARRKIESLMDDLSLGADPDHIRSQVLETALTHSLVSRYTSFVAVDRTPARSAEASLRRAAVANRRPQITPSAAPSGSIAMALPQTDAGTVMRVTLGLVLLILAGIVGGRLRDEQ